MAFGKRIVKDILTWLCIVATAHFVFLKTNPRLAEASLHANNVAVTPHSVMVERARLGLDEPWWRQFTNWLANAFQGNLGQSYVQHESVTHLIARSLPNTLILAASTLLLLGLITYAYACYAVKTKQDWREKGLRLILLSGSAIPSFWLGLILLTVFAMNLAIFPISTGRFSLLGLVLPTITLAAAYIGTYVRLIRNELLQLQDQDYIRYYRYQGLSSRRLSQIMIHNAMSSLLVSLSISIPKILAGSAIVETLFSWPGMGYMCVTAISDRDFPVIQGYIAVMAIVFLVFAELCWVLNRRFVGVSR